MEDLEWYVIQKAPEEIVDLKKPVSLTFQTEVDGNVHIHELLFLSALIRQLKPLNLLEIGTFMGNTTLHMAMNAPKKAIIHTLDLPKGYANTKFPLESVEIKYVDYAHQHEKKYWKTPYQHKIKEHFGDSGDFDFSLFTQNGLLDFVFIDGSHSYSAVASDSKNALRYLNKNGMIVWHDFSLEWPGVYQFLCELDHQLPLIHIEGTTIVLYRNNQ